MEISIQLATFSGEKDKFPKKASCGGYTKDGAGTYKDALLIPSLMKNDFLKTAGYSNVCGQSGFGTSNDNDGAALSTPKTVCSKFYIPIICTVAISGLTLICFRQKVTFHCHFHL